jgi:predicted AlkP superfamily pyrophosphatase or phosphodiesterase
MVHCLGGEPNAAIHRNKPYVLLIGLDGFRFDYAERFGAPNLLALARRGAAAERLLPSFPSKTFPNFYTLATGLHPGEHGITGNAFWDPDRQAEFSFRAPSQFDGSWYGGTPIWVLAEQQGMRTASYFWVGSEAPIQGKHPSEYVPYNSTDSHQDRIRRVAAWFGLPVEQWPHLVTLYFADVDAAGHQHGPEGDEVREAVRRVDATVGELLRSIPAEVNVIIVSDHGMEAPGKVVELGLFSDFPGVRVVNHQSEVMFYEEKPGAVEHTREKLLAMRGDFRVYRKAELPSHLRLRESRRVGDLIVMANGSDWVVVSQPGQVRRVPKGYHGWDVRTVPNMSGIFMAAGPRIRSGIRLKEVPATAIYGLVVNLLQLTPPAGQKIDNGLLQIRRR